MTMISKFVLDGDLHHTVTSLTGFLPIGAQIRNQAFSTPGGAADPRNRLRVVALFYDLKRDTVEYTVERVAP